MSGGRVEIGLGTGWFEAEHTAYGIPFPALGERFDRLEEQLEILTGLWSTPVGSTFTHEGEHYSLLDSPALPKPVQNPLPVIVGGTGAKRTPALAARFAAEYNVPFHSLEETAEAFERVRAACTADERDPGSLVYSAAQVLCCGRDEDEIARRAAAIGREVDELREHGLAGTPAELVAKARTFGAAGASRLYLQVLDLSDHDHVELVAAEVMPHLV
jgi:alkanesulfonate monooxygenase